MKKFLLFLVCLSLSGILFARKLWEEKPYTEWTQTEALSILMKSPWAEDQTFGQVDSSSMGNMVPTRSAPGAGLPSTVPDTNDASNGPSGPRTGTANVLRQYYVRFQSAAPIRMALARLAMLRGRVNAKQAQEFVNSFALQNFIAVSVSLAPGQDRSELDTLTTEKLKNSTYLLLKKSKEKIYLERYMPPGQSGGNEAILLFSRAKDGKLLITVEEEEVRFQSGLSPRTELNRKFKLKDMVLNGKLEI